MQLYLDTEFNGHGGELISMAMVSGNGGGWYCARQIAEPVDPWVAEHVIPKLGRNPLPPDDFRESFLHFVKQHENPEIICDWSADAEHFLRLLAGPDYASSIDYPCSVTILKTPSGQPVSSDPHNALADAVALMVWHMVNAECGARFPNRFKRQLLVDAWNRRPDADAA